MALKFSSLFFLAGMVLLGAGISSHRLKVRAGEEKRGEALLHLLAAVNRPFLEAQAEFLTTVKDVAHAPGVVGAFVTGLQENVPSPEVKSERLEETILGFDQRPLGKAILFFRPVSPSYWFFWALSGFGFLSPLLLSFHQKRREERRKKVEEKKKPPAESYWWLGIFEKTAGKNCAVFDERGNILASGLPQRPSHILDLFSDPRKAQNILLALDSLEKPSHSLRHVAGEEGLAIGCGRCPDETFRYLLVLDSGPLF